MENATEELVNENVRLMQRSSTPKEIELKPCPFCGGKSLLQLFNDGFFDHARIECCHLWFEWCGDNASEQVAKAWNDRVIDKENERLQKELDEIKARQDCSGC